MCTFKFGVVSLISVTWGLLGRDYAWTLMWNSILPGLQPRWEPELLRSRSISVQGRSSRQATEIEQFWIWSQLIFGLPVVETGAAFVAQVMRKSCCPRLFGQAPGPGKPARSGMGQSGAWLGWGAPAIGSFPLSFGQSSGPRLSPLPTDDFFD